MGIAINGSLVSAKAQETVFRLTTKDGKVVKVFKVPDEINSSFQSSMEKTKKQMEEELGCELSLVKIQKVF